MYRIARTTKNTDKHIIAIATSNGNTAVHLCDYTDQHEKAPPLTPEPDSTPPPSPPPLVREPRKRNSPTMSSKWLYSRV